MLNVWKASTLVLAGALALGVGRNAMVSDAAADPQPLMVKAIEQLKVTERILTEATPDKGGHRVLAIKAVKLAIEETNLGIKYDDEHKSDKEREAPPVSSGPSNQDNPNKPHTRRVENPK